MTFEQAMTQMRAGKRVTRPKYKGCIRFGIGIDDGHKHQSPWQNRRIVKFIKMSKPDEKERWRALIVSYISAHDILAADWKTCNEADEKNGIKAVTGVWIPTESGCSCSKCNFEIGAEAAASLYSCPNCHALMGEQEYIIKEKENV